MEKLNWKIIKKTRLCICWCWHLIYFCLGKSERVSLASQVLQFVFLGDGGFRFPVAQFPSGGCTASSLFFIFWEGVRKMMETGFSWVYNNYIINTENSLYCVQEKKHVKFSISLYSYTIHFIHFCISFSYRVYYCILDGAEVNRQFIKVHFKDEQEIIEHKFIASNLFTGKPMVFLMDPKVIDILNLCSVIDIICTAPCLAQNLISPTTKFNFSLITLLFCNLIESPSYCYSIISRKFGTISWKVVLMKAVQGIWK